MTPECEYDRCHRIGRKFKVNGATFQDVLLKLCFWRTQDLLYKNRKPFNFKILADLTQRRTELLEFARNLVEDDEVTKRAEEFVFCNQNCKLKVFSNSKLFYSFSSWEEFMNIIQRLDGEITDWKEFLLDEKKNGLPDREPPNDLFY